MGYHFSDLIKASYRYADHAPGSTCKNPSALSAFLSKKWAIMYSYYCAFSIEASAEDKQFYFFSSPPPYCDLKAESTLMNPVTPPMLWWVKPFNKFSKPSLSGAVPTSNKTQYYGCKYRQKPSKNQRCDDNLVPLVCLKHEKIRKY